MRAVMTGATGFIGKRLVERLNRPAVLVRSPEKAEEQLGDVDAFEWSSTRVAPAKAFEGRDVIFHLAGESVAEGRWTANKKERIYYSRIAGTRNLIRGLEAARERPKVLVAASAIGYYGSRGDEILDESSSAADDFLAKVCKDWEAEALEAEKLGLRVVMLRIGIVLGRGGGAMSKMLLPFKLGLGGRLGSGKQYMSWIHVDDVVGLLEHGANTATVKGPMNGVAPNPVTNIDFTRDLAAAVRRPAFLPVPRPAMRIALGEFATVLFASQRVQPRVALESGYDFRYPTLPEAFAEVVGATNSSRNAGSKEPAQV